VKGSVPRKKKCKKVKQGLEEEDLNRKRGGISQRLS
jgi:hypothetical protein